MTFIRFILMIHMLGCTLIQAQHVTEFEFYDGAPESILKTMQNNGVKTEF